MWLVSKEVVRPEKDGLDDDSMLNAPTYDERAEKNKKGLLIGGFALVVFLVLFTLAGVPLWPRLGVQQHARRA